MAIQSCNGTLRRLRTTHRYVSYMCTVCDGYRQGKISNDVTIPWRERTERADLEARESFVHSESGPEW